MEDSEIRRRGTLDLGTKGPISESCAKITEMIRDHGWELENVGFNAQVGGGQPVHVNVVLVNADPDAEPPRFGYRIDAPQTHPLG